MWPHQGLQGGWAARDRPGQRGGWGGCLLPHGSLLHHQLQDRAWPGWSFSPLRSPALSFHCRQLQCTRSGLIISLISHSTPCTFHLAPAWLMGEVGSCTRASGRFSAPFQCLLLPRQRRRADAAGALPTRRPHRLWHPPARTAAPHPDPRRGGLCRHHQQLDATRLHRGQGLCEGVGCGAAGHQDGRGSAGLLGKDGRAAALARLISLFPCTVPCAVVKMGSGVPVGDLGGARRVWKQWCAPSVSMRVPDWGGVDCWGGMVAPCCPCAPLRRPVCSESPKPSGAFTPHPTPSLALLRLSACPKTSLCQCQSDASYGPESRWLKHHWDSALSLFLLFACVTLAEGRTISFKYK